MFRFNVNSFVIDITIVVVSLLSFILSFYICLSVWLPLIPFLCCDGRDVLALFLFILFNRNSVAVSLYLFINIFIYSGGGGDFQLVSTFTCFFFICYLVKWWTLLSNLPFHSFQTQKPHSFNMKSKLNMHIKTCQTKYVKQINTRWITTLMTESIRFLHAKRTIAIQIFVD